MNLTLFKNIIKKHIKKTLRFAGINCFIEPTFRLKNKHKTNRPCKIEFFGSSGVGKTTLYKKLFRIRSEKDKWIPITAFLQNYDTNQADVFFYSEAHEKLLDMKFRNIMTRQCHTFKKLRYLHFSLDKIQKDAIISKFNSSHKVILDEGIVHNFSKQLSCLFNEDKKAFDHLVAHTAIIYCFSTENKIAENILKRKKKTGRINFQHKELTHNKLLEKIKESLNKNLNLIGLLEDQGIPVLRIDTAEKTTRNANKIRDFINAL